MEGRQKLLEVIFLMSKDNSMIDRTLYKTSVTPDDILSFPPQVIKEIEKDILESGFKNHLNNTDDVSFTIIINKYKPEVREYKLKSVVLKISISRIYRNSTECTEDSSYYKFKSNIHVETHERKYIIYLENSIDSNNIWDIDFNIQEFVDVLRQILFAFIVKLQYDPENIDEFYKGLYERALREMDYSIAFQNFANKK